MKASLHLETVHTSCGDVMGSPVFTGFSTCEELMQMPFISIYAILPDAELTKGGKFLSLLYACSVYMTARCTEG